MFKNINNLNAFTLHCKSDNSQFDLLSLFVFNLTFIIILI